VTTTLDLTDPAEVRRAIRAGTFREFTNRVAPGYVQGNLVILPQRYAGDFRAYCAVNPRPCPLLGWSQPGEPALPGLARDFDVRTDVGEYQIFRDGQPAGVAHDIKDLWRSDLVAFVLGCSFSFEHVLMQAGLPLRHIAERSVSPMYVTDRDTVPKGSFAGKLVVSMRFFPPADAERAAAITKRYPKFHGAPVQIGDAAALGVDLAKPYGGHGLTVPRGDEIPVFWACGQTTQLAIAAARPPLAITHSKAHMVLTDRRSEEFLES
jgi:uncharacterized protein YcsI (UPF0317 family)